MTLKLHFCPLLLGQSSFFHPSSLGQNQFVVGKIEFSIMLLINETFKSDFDTLCSMLMAYYLWPLAMQMISLGSGASFVHEE